jgi:hypothetical protein
VANKLHSNGFKVNQRIDSLNESAPTDDCDRRRRALVPVRLRQHRSREVVDGKPVRAIGHSRAYIAHARQ